MRKLVFWNFAIALLAFSYTRPSYALAEEPVNNECPNENISEIDHNKWHRSLMSQNGYFTPEQLSRINIEVQNCKKRFAWTDEQAQWVLEYMMASKASDALADKLSLLDFEPYSDIELHAWPLADLETLIQNSQGSLMQLVIDGYSKTNNGAISSEAMPILKNYVSHRAAFEIALFKLYGKDLPGSIDISESN